MKHKNIEEAGTVKINILQEMSHGLKDNDIEEAINCETKQIVQVLGQRKDSK